MSRKNWTYEKVFHRLLTNKSKSTYWNNISELRKRPNQEVYTMAYNLTKSKHFYEKIIGINVLAQLGFNPRLNPKKTVKRYIEMLSEELNVNVLEAILYAIGHNSEVLKKDAIRELVTFKNHRYSDIRYALAFALSNVEDEISIETLIELSKDKHSEVRDYATFSLGSQIEVTNDAIINALLDRIDDESSRFEAIAGLAKRKHLKVKKALIEELENIDEYGSLILESIVDFNDPDFIILLEKQIELNKINQNVKEKWLVDSLNKLNENLILQS